jgi:hypothetical protein
MVEVRTPIRGFRWFRRWLFIRAYRILLREADRHTMAGHDMSFSAINEAHLVMHCRECPELLP